MALAGSSQAQVRIIKETVPGETPTSGSPRRLRLTGETLNYNITKDTSQEIDDSRQTSSTAVTDADAGGSINFELSLKEYDELISAVMMNDWSHYGTLGTGVAVPGAIATTDPTFDTFTATTAPTGTSAFTNLKAGQYVRLSGSGLSAGNSGAFQLVEDGTATVLKFAKAGMVAQASASPVFSSSKIQIGKIKKSYSIQKSFPDATTPQHFMYRGMMASKMDLSMQTGSRITGSFEFLGTGSNRANISLMPGGADIPSETYNSMSAVTGFRDVRIGGVPVKIKYDTYVRELTFSLDNQLEALKALGVLGAVDIMAKKAMLTGSMVMYLANGSIYDDFINNANNSFSFVVMDPQGLGGYAFVFDRIDWTEMSNNASADGQAVVIETQYSALKGVLSQNSLTIYRL